MLKRILLLTFSLLLLFCFRLQADVEVPDTVITGIYVTSIHDIDFIQKEFTINFWLWLKYKNKDFNFLKNLELPHAKTFTESYSTIDSSNGQIYLLMKIQCVMKDSWRIQNFPFDRQNLRLSIENSQYDANSLVFVPDTVGQHFDPRFTLSGWRIDSFAISTATKSYETNFGDESIPKPHTEYSAFKVKIGIERDAIGLFWKMFLGMYVAFLIAYACFYIHSDSIDARFSLSVGAIFAVIGNKYIIDSSLPESITFTMVDALHGITLLIILAIIGFNAYALKLIKSGKSDKAVQMDKIAGTTILIVYVAFNAYFILNALRN